MELPCNTDFWPDVKVIEFLEDSCMRTVLILGVTIFQPTANLQVIGTQPWSTLNGEHLPNVPPVGSIILALSFLGNALRLLFIVNTWRSL